MNGSEAVVKAMTFLRDVHRDVAALVEAIDVEADQRGWERTLKNRISTDLSNGMSPEWWVIKYVSRIYTRRGAENPDEVVGISVCLEPEHHDGAVAISVGAKLTPTLSGEGVWWAWKDARPLLKHLSEHPQGGMVPTEVLKAGFVVNAREGSAFVAPLMELKNMEVVRQLLVEPAFAAVR